MLGDISDICTEEYVIVVSNRKNMGTVLITGGAGFIGTNLAKHALNRGWNVKIIDNLSTGLQSNFDELKRLGAEVVLGDVNDVSILEKLSEGCEAVVHLAAQVSVPQSVSNPLETMKVNVEGTQNVIDACIKSNVKRMVTASSAAVYGEADNLPLSEESAGQVLSPYAESKWNNESQILEARQQGVQSTALRFFNVYGEGQRPDGAYAAVIPKFVEMFIQGISPTINGDGLHTRDFVHVDDVCSAIFLLIEGEWKAEKHHVYNVATQVEISLLQLIDAINTSLQKSDENFVALEPKFGPERPGDIKNSVADITRIHSTLGWSPEVNFSTGIERLIRESLNKLGE